MPHKPDCPCPACCYRRGEGLGQAPRLSLRFDPELRERVVAHPEGARGYLERLVRQDGEGTSARSLEAENRRLQKRLEHLEKKVDKLEKKAEKAELYRQQRKLLREEAKDYRAELREQDDLIRRLRESNNIYRSALKRLGYAEQQFHRAIINDALKNGERQLEPGEL